MTSPLATRSLSAAALAAMTALAACTPEEGPSMNPGSDCLECHGGGGEEDGPPWTVAGTVYASGQDTGKGVRGAAIRLVDASGREVTLHSQAVGNFYLADGLAFPLRSVSVERDGVTRTMSAQVAYGGCNRCHRPGGDAGGSLH